LVEGTGLHAPYPTAIDTVLREEYLNLALRHAAEPSSNPLAARVTRIAWHTAAAGYGSST
jgi:hypothetical protein